MQNASTASCTFLSSLILYSGNRKLFQRAVKLLVLTVTLYRERLCKIHTQNSQKGFCIDHHPIIENVNIKITFSGSSYKLTDILCGIQSDFRSEERRVGKESRSQWSACKYRKREKRRRKRY